MLTNQRIDQLLTNGMVDFELYGGDNDWRHWIGKEVDLGVKLRARHSDETWQRTKRATLLLHESSALKRLIFSADRVVPRASGFARYLGRELTRQADKTGIKELSTDFNRIGYNIMKGSEGRPAVIPPHTDPEALQGVVAIMGLFGNALPGSVAPHKSAVTLLACQNLCEAVGIEPVVHASEATEPRITMTLAQIV